MTTARRILVAVLAVAVVLPLVLAGTASAAPQAAVFRIEAEPGTVMTIPGLGRYGGTIEVRRAPNGQLQVINDLPLDAYVEGLAEMPAHWPMEALKAQAVAARTYATWEAANELWTSKGFAFDVCATTACQVFHGREVVETPGVGKRWATAVAETAGEILTYEDEPILARFFSSSGSGTRPNEEVFPRDGHRPYLQRVEDPEDAAASPLARWRVEFTWKQMNAILARGDRLQAVSPVKRFQLLPSDGTRPDHLLVVGKNGKQVELKAWEFRSFVSEMAPELFPGSFPQRREDGGRMPATLPSSRLDFAAEGGKIIVTGTGWGHGVGMSQYGAKGKAEKGWNYSKILGTYYVDTDLGRHETAPDRMRVGLSWNTSEVDVKVDGPARLVTPDHVANVDPGTRWRFAEQGSGVAGTALNDDTVTWHVRSPAGDATAEAAASESDEYPADVDAEAAGTTPKDAAADEDASAVTRLREVVVPRVGGLLRVLTLVFGSD